MLPNVVLKLVQGPIGEFQFLGAIHDPFDKSVANPSTSSGIWISLRMVVCNSIQSSSSGDQGSAHPPMYSTPSPKEVKVLALALRGG